MSGDEHPAASPSAALYVTFFLVYVFFSSNLAAAIPFPWHNYDEHAHYSYVQHLIQHHRWWPDFEHFTMYDAGKITPERNYLNHPPFFYWPLKLMGSQHPATYRYFALFFSSLAIAIYTRIGYSMRLPLLGTVLYLLVPLSLYTMVISGFFNNDAWAMFGGALCCLGTGRWLEKPETTQGLPVLLTGLLFAAVKLTSFLLVSAYVGCVLLLASHASRPLNRTCIRAVLALVVVTALPYCYFVWQYGSPAPQTPGQLAQLTQGMDASDARESLSLWLRHALTRFTTQFGGGFVDLTFLPILCCGIAWVLQFRRKVQCMTTAQTIMIRASAIATCAVLVIHLSFAAEL